MAPLLPTSVSSSPAPSRSTAPLLPYLGDRAASDPSYRPPGGHSANFLASVAANNRGNHASQDVFALGSAPAVNAVGTNGKPRMGLASITTPDGETITRQYAQSADSPETKAARVAANVARHSLSDSVLSTPPTPLNLALAATSTPDPLTESKIRLNDANANAKTLTAGSLASYNDAKADSTRQLTDPKAQALLTKSELNRANVGTAKSRGGLYDAQAGQVESLTGPKVAATNADAAVSTARAGEIEATTPLRVDNLAADTSLKSARAANVGQVKPAAGNEYAAHRQNLDDQIAAARTEMQGYPQGHSVRNDIQKRLNGLMQQRQRLSSQRVDTVRAPATRPAAPVLSSINAPILSGPPSAPASPQLLAPLGINTPAPAPSPDYRLMTPMGFDPQAQAPASPSFSFSAPAPSLSLGLPGTTPRATVPTSLAAPAAPATQATSLRALPRATARQFLQQAGNDKNRAKAMAAQAGFDPMNLVD